MSFLGGQYLPEWQTNRGSVCPRIGGQYPPEWGVSLLRIIQAFLGMFFRLCQSDEVTIIDFYMRFCSQISRSLLLSLSKGTLICFQQGVLNLQKWGSGYKTHPRGETPPI